MAVVVMILRHRPPSEKSHAPEQAAHLSHPRRRLAAGRRRLCAELLQRPSGARLPAEQRPRVDQPPQLHSQFTRQQRVAYFTALFVAFYLVPLLLIAFTCFCIARSLLRTSVLRRQGSLLRQEVNRRKVGKMILIVVLSFTVSWTPYFLVSIITQYQERNFMRDHDFYFTMLCINLFAFLHSAVNPLIYATMSTRFRKSFMRVLRLAVCCQVTPSSGSHGTGMVGAGGQTSFNDQATSSRGSMVNVNVSVHPARLVGFLPAPPPSYRAAMANGNASGAERKRSSFEAFKLSSLIGKNGGWNSRRQSSSSFSSTSAAVANHHQSRNYLKNSCGTATASEHSNGHCSSSMLMREMVTSNCNGKQRRSLAA
ncbi:hypothetical protein TYRP_013673 [Tyrophagus putrescentiae]|nr:hypothetical protein TYRP_013673 [Tyrophagus putrescentiae]